MKKITSLREIQMIELDILLMFDHYCKEHNLNYSIYGGTMLGAVRHSGFIPWDDDMDLCMERSQYQKLIETVSLYPLPDKYRLFSVIDKGYTKPFIKIINTETRVKNLEKDICSGVWIDIFPIDGTPENEFMCLAFTQRIMFLERLLFAATTSLLKAKTVKGKICKIMLFPLARVLGVNSIIKRIDKVAQKYKYQESKFVGNIVWNDVGLRTRQHRALFTGYQEIEFEGHKVSIQNNWESVLLNLYGNYRVLPPEDERRNHHVEAYILEDSDK